ncbi:DUF4252 domain-containing protein [Halpernia frigidisoli]|uniref:Putative auto-transporter adhesin head GIN domain-containing protein n=1 Tax=Halpernia frigidisoli TaxID=1125876 RepID=A0A1I3GIT3_9FLAO|nr:DUF4252 domain-containing protein [Halpernia frigidisoli]SFI23379.1 protein of unknown function [Halpernia frigidisoli]
MKTNIQTHSNLLSTTKKAFVLIAFLFCAILNVSAQREKLDEIFDRYQDSDGITSIKIAKPMFSMLNKLNLGDGELDQIKPLLSKINGLKILVIEKPSGKMVDGKSVKSGLNYDGVQKDISSLLKGLHYEELMSVNSKENKIKFLSAGAKDGILDDLLLNISSNDNMVLMMLDGKISMDDVNNLVNETQNFTTSNSSNSNSSSSNVINRNSEERKVGKFTGLKVSSGIKVNFTQGNDQEIRVETDEDKMQYIATEVKAGILNIYVKETGKKNLNFNKIFVNVVAPEINDISATSGSSLTILNTLKGDKLNIESTSGSNLNGDFNISETVNLEVNSGANISANINAANLNFEGTSGSNATIKGKVSKANFKGTSAANCNAQNLNVENAFAQATSASTVSVNVSGNLKADASSGGKIRYKGNPTIDSNISKMSGGSLVKF